MSREDIKKVGVAIIGTGFSGMGMAIRLQQSGRSNFTIFEKASDVGGCWRDNTYPGCCCDIPSHLYSFSFEQRADWSRKYPSQNEIHQYLKSCADKYHLLPKIQFNSDVVEIRYRDQDKLWMLSMASGEKVLAKFVIAGKGPLHIPSLPAIDGLESFDGEVFHSSQWDHSFDLKGKRVAVVGTGASAIQFIPQIAPKVNQLHVLQRSPGWMLPRPDRAIRSWEKYLYKKIPSLLNLYRKYQFWTHEMRVIAFREGTRLHQKTVKMAEQYMRSQVSDPEVQEKLLPDFSLGCKRMLISNDYYETFNRDNVELIASGIDRVDGNKVIAADGSSREVDAIIFGTGFEAADPIAPKTIYGPADTDLFDRWDDEGAQAYKGVSVSGLPNFFFLVGPNSGLGHNSMILMIEAQIQYILDCFEYMDSHELEQWEVQRSAQDSYNQAIQGDVDESIWSSGCRSWYINKKGRNTTVWPGFVYQYQREMKRLEVSAYGEIAES